MNLTKPWHAVRRSAESYLRDRRHRPNGVLWQHLERVHLRLHSGEYSDMDAHRIERALESELGVEWARVQPRLGCVVLQFDADKTGIERLSLALAAAENGIASRGKPVTYAHPDRHPGDFSLVVRSAIEIAAEVTSLGVGYVLRRSGAKPLPIEIDLAALVELVSGIPQIRKALERRASVSVTALGLTLAHSVVQTLLHSETGPVVGVVRSGLQLREHLSRRALWSQLEPELCSTPVALARNAERYAARPAPLSPGPIERYTDHASVGLLGAFLASLLSTRNIASSAGSIFAASANPARRAREAFCAHLGHRLATEGALVIDPHALRRLDRISAVVVDGRLLSAGDQLARRMVTTSLSTGLRCVVATAELATMPLPRECVKDARASAEIIDELQREGLGVCGIGLADWSGLSRADFCVGIMTAGAAPPWSADLIIREAEHAQVLIHAIHSARLASEQGVYLSLLDAAIASGIAIAGFDSATTRRIMLAANATSLFSMLNGARHAQSVPFHRSRSRVVEDKQVPPPWHSLIVEEALQRLGTSMSGLSGDQALARRRPHPPAPTAVARLAHTIGEELMSPLAPVLMAGAGLSLAARAPGDAALIAAVFSLNALVGGVHHFRAEQDLAKLLHRERRPTRVLRAGRHEWLDSDELVPGDIIELVSGEVVPADCRIVGCRGLEVDESSLTGESFPVTKSEQAVEAEAIADRTSMLYEGTVVAAGHATGAVTSVGEDTEARSALQEVAGPPRTGVQARLEKLTFMTAPIAAASGIAMAVTAALRGRDFKEVLGSGVSLAVAAVPEGLPLLSTVAQLTTAQRLARRGALVRNPAAIEALGRVDVLCADKTGTLTEGKIQLRIISDGCEFQELDELSPSHRQILSVALRASPSTQNGDPLPHLTDRALVAAARRTAVQSHDTLSDWRRLGEMPFEPSRGFHAGLAQHSGGSLLSMKGAPEVILLACSHWRRGDDDMPMTDALRRELDDEAVRLARLGYRVLAVAERSSENVMPLNAEELRDLRFRGFVAFADPIRSAARAAIDGLRRAGVSVIMATGDHPSTAEAIATELGLRNGSNSVIGAQLDQLDDTELEHLLKDTTVFARMTPAQKIRIVAALQRAGRVVAMTGDGANDAPAIRLADVGIALGKNSTTAAREAADLIVVNERIETIVDAVLEGRGLWTSVRDAVSILVGGNLGEIFFTLGGSLIGGSSPLNVRQLLLVNLVTDTLPALTIAMRPPSSKEPEELLREGPDVSLAGPLTSDIVWRAAITAGSALAAWLPARIGDKRGAGSVAVLAITGSQLLQTMLAGSRSWPVIATSAGSLAFVLAAVQTPSVSKFFGCRPLGPLGLAQAALGTAVGACGLAVQKLSREPS